MYSLLISNPAHGATLPKYQHAEMQIWDEFQVIQFLSAASESRYEALYHLAVKTGMRQGELFGLKWSDLQWHNGTLLSSTSSAKDSSTRLEVLDHLKRSLDAGRLN